MIHITTLPEFERLINSGFITIVDNLNNTVKVHKVNCHFVSSSNFKKKVIENKEKNGRYYWSENVHKAISELQAEPCLVFR